MKGKQSDNSEFSNVFQNFLLLIYFRFYPSKVKKVIEKCIVDKMKDKTYDYKECEKMAKDISSNIKEAVKKLNIPWYKIIVQTVIGEIGG